MAIWTEPRPTRKARSADALRKAGNDPWVLCSVARLFWAERKIEQARRWFDRAVAASERPSDTWGDIWAWWLKFERQHGTKVRARAWNPRIDDPLLTGGFECAGAPRRGGQEGYRRRTPVRSDMAAHRQGRCEYPQEHKGDT